MSGLPRVAFFADSFHEVNGAAQACRQLEAHARRRGYPLLSVRCGPEAYFENKGPVWVLQFRRGRASFHVDRDLCFDPMFFRRRRPILTVLEEFRPDVIHVTSPGDMGILGAWAAHTLRVPLAASWHTNLHEFAARRLHRTLRWLPDHMRRAAVRAAEAKILEQVLWYYGLARFALAPNEELVAMIAQATRRPAFLMWRGVDTALFSPSRRDRTGGDFTLGFVGRLTAEKNVRFLSEIEKALLRSAAPPFRFAIVGDGDEKGWLRSEMWRAAFPGLLRGEALAREYANMDLFVFPSRTDAFGNAVLEALASGVPAVVTDGGGPKFLVQQGLCGFVAASDEEFIRSVLGIIGDRELHARMRRAAVERASHYSWERVFEEQVYGAYRRVVCGGAGTAEKRETEAGSRSE